MEIQFSNIPVSLDAMLPENTEMLNREVAKACGLKVSDIEGFRILKKSVDARRKSNVHFVLTVVVSDNGYGPFCPGKPGQKGPSPLSEVKPQKGVTAKEYVAPKPLEVPDLSGVANKEGYLRPIVAGAGPAGLFCALYLARAGLRPLVIERGKPADERMRDIKAFADGGPLNVNSNVQFGEGGAGTFSDGKLNTGIKSPHIRHVLQEFVEAGAPEDILVNAKPHIGTDKLVEVVQNLRRKIEAAGGEFWFNTRLEKIGIGIEALEEDAQLSRSMSFRLEPRRGEMEKSCYNQETRRCFLRLITGFSSSAENGATGEEVILQTDACVLAIGHSARDTFAMLKDAGIEMRRKPFAMGVRIEHLQEDVNRSQYGKFANHPALGAADYKLATHNKDGRGVYTFCMCPGGEVVAAASEEGGVCVNGMSEHARAGKNANSALLVEITPEDLPGDDVLEGIALQRELEHAAYCLGSENTGIPYTAPVQTVESFLEGSKSIPSAKVEPTYPRDIAWEDLHDCLPQFMTNAIAEALPEFGKKLDAFKDGQAVMTAVEARSSSPVKIIRDGNNMNSPSVCGLYPCGEGAGYAGGIMSAAVDGIRVAEAICASFLSEGSRNAAAGTNEERELS